MYLLPLDIPSYIEEKKTIISITKYNILHIYPGGRRKLFRGHLAGDIFCFFGPFLKVSLLKLLFRCGVPHIILICRLRWCHFYILSNYCGFIVLILFLLSREIQICIETRQKNSNSVRYFFLDFFFFLN